MRRVASIAGVFVLLLLGGALFPARAIAGPNANAKLLVHIPNIDARSMCAAATVPCSRIVTAGTLYPPRTYNAFIIVTDGDAASGIKGVTCSIKYDSTDQSGVDIWNWTTCADNFTLIPGPHGDWPTSLSTNVMTWDQCRRYEPGGSGTGVSVTACYFYCGAYSPDTLAIVPSLSTNLVTVMNCAGVVDTVAGGEVNRTVSHLGFAVFSQTGTVPGYNPCGLNTGAEPTTWSRIKALSTDH